MNAKPKQLLLWLALLGPPALLLLQSDLPPLSRFAAGAGSGALGAWAIALALGCRSRLIVSFFGSLASTYRMHHRISLAVLPLLALHLGMMLWPFAEVDLPAAAVLLLGVDDPIILTGWIATALFLIALALAFRKRMERNKWRSAHRIFLLGLLAAAGHFLAARPDPAPAQGLSAALLALSLALAGAFYLLPAALRQISPYRVENARQIGPATVAIELSPLHRAIAFEPGQFFYLSVNCLEGCGVSREFHPFSPISRPGERLLTFVVRALGDDSRRLLDIKPGNLARVEGPYGNLLSPLSPSLPQLWIAGGVGITPFLSALRTWRDAQRGPFDIVLLSLEKKLAEAGLQAEIPGPDGVRLIQHIDERDGPPRLAELLPADWRKRSVVITGSAAMVHAFSRQLRSWGAKEIHSEELDL